MEIIFSSSAREASRLGEVEAALRTISQYYEVSLAEISAAVSSLPFDLILGRIPDEYVRNDSVELIVADKYISNMKLFLASSATTEINNETSFRRTLKEGVEYAGNCRFAHTFKGSFGFVIESPVGLNDSPTIPSIDEEKPFQRKVVERIARGLSSYSKAILTEDSSIIANASSGFSANMCDDLVSVIEDTGVSKITLSVQMSPEWRSEPPGFGQAVAVEHRYLDLLKDASRSLRHHEVPKQETVMGRVVKLSSDGNPSDLLSDVTGREAVISWDSVDYGLIKVSVLLTPQGYLDAVEAHKVGGLVSVSGTLAKKGRSWTLSGPANVRRLQ